MAEPNERASNQTSTAAMLQLINSMKTPLLEVGFTLNLNILAKTLDLLSQPFRLNALLNPDNHSAAGMTTKTEFMRADS